MKRILVPTDFSICSSKAIDYAIAICKRIDAELILLHTCELMDENLENSKSYVQKYNNDIQDEANSKLELLKSSIVADNSIQVSVRLYAGPLSNTIIYVAKRYNVDLVVMGTHGASGMKQLIMGSETASVIAKCEIPVLAIPTDYHFISKGDMMLAINESGIDIEELQPVLLLSDAFDMNITLLTFTDQDQPGEVFLKAELILKEAKEKLLLQGFIGEITTMHIKRNNFLHSLQELITKLQIDVICMITHKREGLKKIWNKSMTRKMAYHTNVPLLAIPHTEFGFIETETEAISSYNKGNGM